jgi:hypothetical protein
MVNVEELVGVLAPVVIVSMEAVVAGFGLKVAVAPVDRPLTLRLTGLVKPPDGVIVRLYVVEPPCVTVWLDGVELTVKFGAITISETLLVCVKAPPVPVIVSVEEPPGVLAVVVIVSVDGPVAGFVLKVPVAPGGRPLTLRSTGPVKPPVGVIVRLYVVEQPCVTIWLDGEKLIVKSGTVTTNVAVAL